MMGNGGNSVASFSVLIYCIFCVPKEILRFLGASCSFPHDILLCSKKANLALQATSEEFSKNRWILSVILQVNYCHSC